MTTTPLDNELTVKPLVFLLDDFTGYQTACPMDGIYYNIKHDHIWAWKFGDNFFKDVGSEDEAKAACQADWLERIGKALC